MAFTERSLLSVWQTVSTAEFVAAQSSKPCGETFDTELVGAEPAGICCSGSLDLVGRSDRLHCDLMDRTIDVAGRAHFLEPFDLHVVRNLHDQHGSVGIWPAVVCIRWCRDRLR